MPGRFCFLLAAALSAMAVIASARTGQSPPDTELDAFMARVLARRDDNWRKLQQYVLDERERAELLGPGDVRMYGLGRDYTWYIRDGVFVRSPVRFDGVALGDADRQKYEREWVEREKARAAKQDADQPAAAPPVGPAADGTSADADTIAHLAREPQFVSMAYFLKFKFERGHYAFAGREKYEGQSVYKIEYYPARLFTDDEGSAGQKREKRDGDEEERLERQMNKVALVTLWIEPERHQVLRYVFQNIGLDFLPGRWLVRVDDFGASMRMLEAFPGVWLPRGIEGQGRVTLASGTYTFRYRTEYENYREATVKARIR
jgi:hypothetical protein